MEVSVCNFDHIIPEESRWHHSRPFSNVVTTQSEFGELLSNEISTCGAVRLFKSRAGFSEIILRIMHICKLSAFVGCMESLQTTASNYSASKRHPFN